MSTAPRPQRRAAEGRRPRPVETVRATTRSTRPSLGARIIRISTVVAVFLAVLVLFGLVASHAFIVRNQGRIDAVNADIAEAARTSQELHLVVAQLEAPDRIRAEAIGRLGMVEPEEVMYLEPLPAATLGDIVDGSPAGASAG